MQQERKRPQGRPSKDYGSVMYVRLTKTAEEKVKKFCDDLGMPIAEFIRRAVEEKIKNDNI